MLNKEQKENIITQIKSTFDNYRNCKEDELSFDNVLVESAKIGALKDSGFVPKLLEELKPIFKTRKNSYPYILDSTLHRLVHNPCDFVVKKKIIDFLFENGYNCKKEFSTRPGSRQKTPLQWALGIDKLDYRPNPSTESELAKYLRDIESKQRSTPLEMSF